jgi:hypothetical protein
MRLATAYAIAAGLLTAAAVTDPPRNGIRRTPSGARPNPPTSV